jgi:hypothetical protein
MAGTSMAGNAPKGCFEKTWNKGELKKLPLQKVTAVRLEANLGPLPENQPKAYGRLMARFRDTGEEWLSTPYECSDTGAGYACAAHCDGNVFVLSQGGKGLQVMPTTAIQMSGEGCEGNSAKLRMNADNMPFLLNKRSGKACQK